MTKGHLLPWILFIQASAAPELTSPLRAAERVKLEVREAAGIRRFSYPVSARLPLDPPAPAGTRFRLLEKGSEVPAQFRAVEERGGRASVVAIDFDASFLPWEARVYEVEHGTDVAPASEPAPGLRVEEAAEELRIVNGPAERPQIAWKLRRDLAGLFLSVKTPSAEYAAAGSQGLVLRGRDGRTAPLGGLVRGRALKQGPFACQLRFEGACGLGGARPVSSTVDVEVPRSKSWARVEWRVDDPEGLVAGLEAGMQLEVEGGTAYLDFGADTLVYAALRKGQAASFRAGLQTPAHRLGGEPFWQVLRGPPEKLEPYVDGGLAGTRRVEGWAHLMDGKRCAALAVAGFGRQTLDRIDADAEGQLKVSRDFAADADAERACKEALETKELLFWVHFVDFPPHVGAVTSPQSMAAPLEARWRTKAAK